MVYAHGDPGASVGWGVEEACAEVGGTGGKAERALMRIARLLDESPI